MGLSELNFASGFENGMNSGLRLLAAMDNKREQAIQRKRADTEWEQKQEAYNYDKDTLRPLRLEATQNSLSSQREGIRQLANNNKWAEADRPFIEEERDYRMTDLKSQVDYNKESRPLQLQAARDNQQWLKQERDWKREDRPFEQEQQRWHFEQLKTEEERAAATERRTQQTYNLGLANSIYESALAAYESGDEEQAISLMQKADDLSGGLFGNMASGTNSRMAKMAYEVDTGKRKADDPEFTSALRDFTRPTMRVTGRDNDYSMDGLESLPNGKIGYRLKPKFGGKYNDIIEREAQRQGVDPDLVRAVIGQESSGNPNAVSPKNAGGVMQLIPGTFNSMAHKLGIKSPDRFNPEHNIATGIAYLKEQLQDFGGDPQLALAAYNAGPAAVRKHKGIPPFKETQQYVPAIMSNYRKLKQGVPATHAQSSNPNDPVVAYSRDDMVAKVQHGAQAEQEFNTRTPQPLKAALLQRAAGFGAKKTSPADWERLDDDTLYNKRTGEVKELTPKIGKAEKQWQRLNDNMLYNEATGETKPAKADNNKQSLLNMHNKNGEVDPAWKAKAIEGQLGDLPYEKRAALLQSLEQVDSPVEVEKQLKAARIERDAGELTTDFMTDVDPDRQLQDLLNQAKTLNLDEKAVNKMVTEFLQLQGLSNRAKALGLDEKTINKMVTESMQVLGDTDVSKVFQMLDEKLKIAEIEKQRAATWKRKSQASGPPSEVPSGVTAGIFP